MVQEVAQYLPLPHRTKERRTKHSIEMTRHYCPTCGALLNPLAYIGRKQNKKRVLYCEYCIESNKPPELYTKTVEIEEPQDCGRLDMEKLFEE